MGRKKGKSNPANETNQPSGASTLKINSVVGGANALVPLRGGGGRGIYTALNLKSTPFGPDTRRGHMTICVGLGSNRNHIKPYICP